MIVTIDPLTGLPEFKDDPPNISVSAGGGRSGGVQSVVAGTNITVDSTDPANPIVNSTGGSGGVTIGDPVTGGDPYSFLTIDPSGNLADDQFKYMSFNVFGLIDGQYLMPAALTTIGIGGLDATPFGGSPTIGFLGQSTSPWSVIATDIDTLNTYLTISKDALNLSSFGFWSSGQNVDGQPDFAVNGSGLALHDGVTVKGFQIDLTSNSDSYVPTVKAVQTAINAIGSTTPGGSDKQIQYNNNGVFGGMANTTYDNTLAFPNIGFGITSPISPIDIRTNTGNSVSPAVNINYISAYTGSSTANGMRISFKSNNAISAGFQGFESILATQSGKRDSYFLNGFNAQVDVNADNTSTVGTVTGATMRITNNNGALTGDSYGMRIYSALGSFSSVIAGLYVDDQTVGATNYAIYTNLGKVRFGDNVSTTGSLTINTLSGLLKATSGLVSVATAGTDYVTPTGSTTLTNKSISGSTNTFTNIPESAVTNLVSDLAALPPRFIDLNPAVRPALAGTAPGWTPTAISSIGGAYFQLSTSANDNTATWELVLDAGTWEISFTYRTTTTNGIATFTLGGATVGTVDTYAAATVNGNQTFFTGISVTTAGRYSLVLSNATKNASATAYRIQPQALGLRRTGP